MTVVTQPNMDNVIQAWMLDLKGTYSKHSTSWFQFIQFLMV